MAFEDLKARQSVMWANGPYQNITETLIDIHELIIDELAPAPGVRWLDLACGTGAVAERAAAAGASVVGVDLAPGLIDTAQKRAAELGLDIDYRVGDCEALDLEDAGFDVVSSTCGVMFAPDHAAAARELARVTRPGGRIGLANWTPEGGVGEMFRVMAPFQPAPPPSSPFDWGKRERLQELLAENFDLDITEHVSTVRSESGQAYWELFSSSYGPTKTLAENLGERRSELQQAWVDLYEAKYGVDGGIAHTREYLLVIGRRR
ncbi:MAG TPA: class I SAM-dependent methyltransferase [Mycobacteriales bacterium]|nr:class I SAM-dependent methyltransferase [Mycobacteriales bacterium]